MLPRYASGWVKLLLQVTVILIFLLSTTCTEQCKPTSTEGGGSVIIRNVGIKMCQLKCDESGQCLSIQYNSDTLTCRLLRAESRKTKSKEGYVSLERNRPDVQTGSCSSKMCSIGQRCLKTRSGKSVCVQDEKQNYPEKSPQLQVNKKELFEKSSLHQACSKGNLTRVRHILSKGLVDINSTEGYHGKTPLMVGAQEEHCRLFSLLITKGANISQEENDCENILYWACKGGHVGMVECLLPQYRTGIKNKHVSPLMHAAFSGKRDLFHFLVCMGANVSQVDCFGRTVLHWGCKGGHLDMVEYLLSLGGQDINRRTLSGWTVLMFAVYRGQRDVFDILVRKGANVSQVDCTGNTVLHLSCSRGHLGIVKYLLSLGSLDINSRGQHGRTPLMKAAYCGRKDVFDFLVRMGANVSQVGNYKRNVLHLASFHGHVELVKDIVSQSMVDIKARDKYGKTAAMRAKRNPRIYDFLVSQGCPVK